MLKLAELLCLHRIKITFLNTHHIHRRLSSCTTAVDNLTTKYPDFFRFETFPDGLPQDNPRTGDQIPGLLDSMDAVSVPILREMVTDSGVSCVIADGILGFTCDVANEIGVPIFYVRTISAACLWVFFCLPKLIQSGELPFQGNDLDILVKSVPGMEKYLRRRDLPSFCRSGDVSKNPNIEMYKAEREEIPRAYGLILNTFEELEGPILRETRAVCPNIYTIGPLHAHLKSKLAASTAFSNSLWEEDRSCMAWLDSQPPRSVIYVSFGSLATMTHGQLMEFWHGLMNSGHKFLWVIRPDSVAGSKIPEVTKEQEVLAHPAVGGFLTHSGWNSTLESVYEGVPMICWPYFVDQQVNSRLVEVEWKLGLDMKDTCDRSVIEKTVASVMDVRKQEFLERAGEMAKSARRCLSEGGSSYCNLERLIGDIKSAQVAVHHG
ncbi:7-deoxyloganetic acid glucosyltransferase [Phtheirospermum japonicum]|uniref:7-deoxyloganetic acid glucosyltransferase n=1 Tax=Phtheirospermum japonicum TaxID=374723 RepID=A0A830BJQ2_9LAMI|nr:7-deoxyloganetic acid glucosyltransferase [Phtheirospermum japonicum]